MDNKPIHMWDPRQLPPHAPTPQHHTTTPNNDDYPPPVAIIEDDATPTQITSHSVPHCQTCAQHCAAHKPCINSAITKAFMLLIDFKPTEKYPAHGYIATTQALCVQTYDINPLMASQPNIASINFIGTIVKNIMGNILEY
jgi:hypothetical protein